MVARDVHQCGRNVQLCGGRLAPYVARGYGKIVLFSSMAAYKGGLVVGTEYTTSKTAVIGITRHVARNGAQHNIYCNAVAPGSSTRNSSRPSTRHP